MNNSVFGKTIENRKLVSSPSFDRFTIFGNDMVSIHMHKTRLELNKPVYTGMTILENTKNLMYDFFYNHLKVKYRPKCELIYTDIDSLLLSIQIEDVYRDMEHNFDLYDTSNYPKDHPLFSPANKKVLGKIKDECGGLAIEEVVAVRSKMYSIKKAEKKNIGKAKGVKKM